MKNALKFTTTLSIVKFMLLIMLFIGWTKGFDEMLLDFKAEHHLTESLEQVLDNFQILWHKYIKKHYLTYFLFGGILSNIVAQKYLMIDNIAFKFTKKGFNVFLDILLVIWKILSLSIISTGVLIYVLVKTREHQMPAKDYYDKINKQNRYFANNDKNFIVETKSLEDVNIKKRVKRHKPIRTTRGITITVFITHFLIIALLMTIGEIEMIDNNLRLSNFLNLFLAVCMIGNLFFPFSKRAKRICMRKSIDKIYEGMHIEEVRSIMLLYKPFNVKKDNDKTLVTYHIEKRRSYQKLDLIFNGDYLVSKIYNRKKTKYD